MRFIRNCQDAYSVSVYFIIDEQLSPFKGKCLFKQYIHGQLARSALKIQTLCDARTWYTLYLELHPDRQPDAHIIFLTLVKMLS